MNRIRLRLGKVQTLYIFTFVLVIYPKNLHALSLSDRLYNYTMMCRISFVQFIWCYLLETKRDGLVSARS